MQAYEKEYERMTAALSMEMMGYYEDDPRRIQHFIKVHSLARLIGLGESLDERQQFALESAALVHDIGIKRAEEKYGRCDGKLQEQEGPGEADKMLEALGYDAAVRERICYLVGHHHTYRGITGADYQILVEADFLVNLYEDQSDAPAVKSVYEKIFVTKTGKEIFRRMYGGMLQ